MICDDWMIDQRHSMRWWTENPILCWVHCPMRNQIIIILLLQSFSSILPVQTYYAWICLQVRVCLVDSKGCLESFPKHLLFPLYDQSWRGQCSVWTSYKCRSMEGARSGRFWPRGNSDKNQDKFEGWRNADILSPVVRVYPGR